VIRTPVKFDISQLIGAGANFDALTGWQNETPDTDCMIEVLERATAVGLVSVLSSSNETLKQQGPVQSGGTAGVTPSRLNTEPITGKAPKFQKLRLFYSNPTGGGITVDLTVILTPLGGGGGGGVRRAAPVRRRKRR
jgi:hypothetical protein